MNRNIANGRSSPLALALALQTSTSKNLESSRGPKECGALCEQALISAHGDYLFAETLAS